MLKTSIIILTHNQLIITQQCLESIRKHTSEDYELILVDNGSTDGTVEYLQNQADIRTVCNSTNFGFAKGCNQGVEIATGDSMLFLNNDTVVTSNWLGNMLSLLHSSSKIGMIGPVSNNVSGHQKIAVHYQEISGLDEFAQQHCQSNAGQWKRVFRLVGFCLLVKKEVLDDIGVFDEQFGKGSFEDDDLCMRVVKRGYHLRIALDSFVHHIGQVTFHTMAGANVQQLMAENRQKATAKWGIDEIGNYLHNLSEITISLCIIVKDEETVIARCLDTVQDIVDEIIIVDTGSTDRTKEIVSRYTNLIYDFPWIDDFAAARNYAFSLATMEYTLWLDAADVLLEEDHQKLLELKSVRNNYFTVLRDTTNFKIFMHSPNPLKTLTGFNEAVPTQTEIRITILVTDPNIAHIDHFD